MGGVIKDDLSFEGNLAFEQPGLMATRTKAARVLHLGEGL
jgi:hypothetical protein